MADTNADAKKYSLRVIVMVGKKKQYRDIVEACRQPSSLGQIYFNLTKKMGRAGLSKALNRLVRAKIIYRTTEYRNPWQPTLYKVTDIGLRLLDRAPGNRKSVQWVLGGDNLA